MGIPERKSSIFGLYHQSAVSKLSPATMMTQDSDIEKSKGPNWYTAIDMADSCQQKTRFPVPFFGLFFATWTQGIGRDRTGLATFDQSDIRVSRRMTCFRRGTASV
jgi:hypothetical protein